MPSWAPLLRVALFRTADDAHHLAWSNHHLLMDGWCLPIVLGEVLACYEAVREGRDPALPPPRPYRDYIAWLRRLDLAEAEAYWRRALRRVPRADAARRGPALRDERAPGPETHAERSARLPAAATAALAALARAHQLTLNTVVQGAWAILLSRYAGRDDVVFGVTVSGRPADLPGVETMVGLFINTLPLRVAVPEDAPLLPWLADLQGTAGRAAPARGEPARAGPGLGRRCPAARRCSRASSSSRTTRSTPRCWRGRAVWGSRRSAPWSGRITP